jgi:hypothetical protein
MALVGEPIPDYVQRQIQVRQASYGSGSLPDLPRTDEILLHQNAGNAFIKMASGVSVSSKKLEEMGFDTSNVEQLKGMGLAKNYVLFGGTAQISQFNNDRGGTDGILFQKTEFLGDNGAYSLENDFGIVPMPGIESLEIKALNRGSLKKATVKLTAQTRNQLAILDVLYMRLGYTVLLEWGNSIYMASSNREKKDGNIESGRLQKMYTSIIEDNALFFNSSWSSHKSYSDISTKIAKVRELYDGNYDALLGKVSNFNWSFNPDGSYSIELTIISLGDIVESLKTNVPASYETLAYVDQNDLTWATEGEPIDQHRKDNIILSLLHVFRLVNISPTGTAITIYTKKGNDPNFGKKATLGNLLVEGEAKLSTSDHFLTETVRVGFQDNEKWISSEDLVEGYYDSDGRILTEKEAKEIASNQKIELKDLKGYGYGKFSKLRNYGQNNTEYIDYAKIVFSGPEASYAYSETNTTVFSEVDWKTYNEIPEADQLTDPSISNNPIVLFRKKFVDEYSGFTLKGTKKLGNNSNFSPQFLIQGRFLRANDSFINALGSETNPNTIKFAQAISKSLSSKNFKSFKNPLKGTGYQEKDAFVIKLDKPQYYVRLGYLLSLLKQKVITRVKINAAKYDDNPNIFDIDTSDNNKMLCLPLQISFDWRTCIVSRKDFYRDSWQQNILPEINEWRIGETNTANIMNIYLNFNFLADAMSSNMDERGNISVYDFIKSICDGINKAMAGVNNLEPVIDEDTNTLQIFESSPIPKDSPPSKYTLQLYGYGNGATSPAGNSTFVRKVDLKTAITPEYATMITVGATANGYVKGTEATAFARWNDGLTDRFKTELIAADKDTNDDAKGTREDTANSFNQAMSWNAKCFGIEGGGNLWDMFPSI